MIKVFVILSSTQYVRWQTIINYLRTLNNTDKLQQSITATSQNFEVKKAKATTKKAHKYRKKWIISAFDFHCLHGRSMSLSQTGFHKIDEIGNRGFHKLYEIGNNTNIDIRGFTTWKKSSEKMLPPVGIEPRPLIASDSKSNTILSTLTWHLLARLRL